MIDNIRSTKNYDPGVQLLQIFQISYCKYQKFYDSNYSPLLWTLSKVHLDSIFNLGFKTWAKSSDKENSLQWSCSS